MSISHLNPEIREDAINANELVISIPREGSLHALNQAAAVLYRIYTENEAGLSEDAVIDKYISHFAEFDVSIDTLRDDALAVIHQMKEKNLLWDEDGEDDVIAWQRRIEDDEESDE
jgi:hypothetical protein